jgi:hypothetical protein
LAKCECTTNTFGNPTVACLPSTPAIEPSLAAGCSNNDDCPEYTACENLQCVNPCAQNDPCAAQATCRVITHKVVCTCPNGYIGSPQTNCHPPVKPECTKDSECPNNLACIQDRCQDPCPLFACGVNAECRARDHRATCTCLAGFEGDPYTVCIERKTMAEGESRQRQDSSLLFFSGLQE